MATICKGSGKSLSHSWMAITTSANPTHHSCSTGLRGSDAASTPNQGQPSGFKLPTGVSSCWDLRYRMFGYGPTCGAAVYSLNVSMHMSIEPGKRAFAQPRIGALPPQPHAKPSEEFGSRLWNAQCKHSSFRGFDVSSIIHRSYTLKHRIMLERSYYMLRKVQI